MVGRPTILRLQQAEFEDIADIIYFRRLKVENPQLSTLHFEKKTKNQTPSACIIRNTFWKFYKNVCLISSKLTSENYELHILDLPAEL